MNAPCKTCNERGCGKHSECEKYLAYQAQRNEIRAARMNEQMLNGYTVCEVMKAKRSSRKKG